MDCLNIRRFRFDNQHLLAQKVYPDDVSALQSLLKRGTAQDVLSLHVISAI